MKSKFIFFVLFIISIPLSAENFYNFYYRNNYEGTFEIANVEADECYKFNYCFEEDKIIGYYYDSDVVKFVDKVNDNHILSSTYYDVDQNVLYERQYIYKKNKLSRIITILNDSQRNQFYKSQIDFSTTKDGFKFQEKNLAQAAITQAEICKGYLNKSYEPIEINKKVKRNRNGFESFFKVKECYFYESDVLKSFEIISAGQKDFVCELSREDGKFKRKEIRFIDDNTVLSECTFFADESTLTTIFKTNRSETKEIADYHLFGKETYRKEYESFRHIRAAEYYTQDEKVTIWNGQITEQLNLKCSVYSSEINTFFYHKEVKIHN